MLYGLHSNNFTRWSKLVPKKVNILVWRAIRDRLATRVNLDLRNIDLHSVLCPYCDSKMETIEHLMVSYNWSNTIWSYVFQWWGFCLPQLSRDCSLLNIIDFVRNLSQRKKAMFKPIQLRCFEAVLFSSLWIIWYSRNRKVFMDKSQSSIEVFKEIKQLSYNWIGGRCTKLSIKWNDWIKDPIIVCIDPNS